MKMYLCPSHPDKGKYLNLFSINLDKQSEHIIKKNYRNDFKTKFKFTLNKTHKSNQVF